MGEKRLRKSIRLKGYDYSKEGAYFITICTYERQRLFGKIIDGKMALNEYGKIARDEWLKTTQLRKNVSLDEFIIMPNHFHGIICINETARRGVMHYAPTSGFRPPSQTIGSIIRGFKSAVTKRINEYRKTPKRYVWQRNYYERVIRDEIELNEKRDYIKNNPITWNEDINNINMN